eukprot:6070066-Pyramimonas_sp.AAC.1
MPVVVAGPREIVAQYADAARAPRSGALFACAPGIDGVAMRAVVCFNEIVGEGARAATSRRLPDAKGNSRMTAGINLILRAQLALHHLLRNSRVEREIAMRLA